MPYKGIRLRTRLINQNDILKSNWAVHRKIGKRNREMEIPSWHSGLRIQHFHRSGTGHCCGTSLIPGRRKNRGNKQKTNKMAAFSPNVYIVTFNINGLNTPNKRQRLTEWITKHDQPYLQEIYFKSNNIDWKLGWK